jgi:hypothetical protein
MKTLLRHLQPVIHNLARGRWIKGNVLKLGLAAPVYSPLSQVGNLPPVTVVEGQVLPGKWSAMSYFTGGTPPVWYSAADLPPGVSIDTFTGKITGTVAAGSAGPYSATITAHDQLTTAVAGWDILVEISSFGASAFSNEFDQRAFE